jgi:hypothetical protein
MLQYHPYIVMTCALGWMIGDVWAGRTSPIIPTLLVNCVTPDKVYLRYLESIKFYVLSIDQYQVSSEFNINPHQ